MTDRLRAAAEAALEALNFAVDKIEDLHIALGDGAVRYPPLDDVSEYLCAALVETEVEPVDDVWFEDRNGAGRKSPKDCQRFGANGVPVAVWVNGNRYTRREWQGLTQEELEAALGLTECTDLESATNLIVAARAIEAALKETNHDSR